MVSCICKDSISVGLITQLFQISEQTSLQIHILFVIQHVYSVVLICLWKIIQWAYWINSWHYCRCNDRLGKFILFVTILYIHLKKTFRLSVDVSLGFNVRKELILLHPGEIYLTFESKIECIVSVLKSFCLEFFNAFH